MAIKFTHPECVALNRQGILSGRQRKAFLLDCVAYVVGALAIMAVGVGLVIAGGSKAMAAICVFVGGIIFWATLDSWKIYRDPKPEIVVKRGLLHPVERIPINRGGTVGIGEERVFLKRDQIREVRFGHNYEIFVVMPYRTPISADPIDL